MVFFPQTVKNNISVHGLRTRTTSSLESYNAWIGHIFPKHANFFRFAQILNREIEKQYCRFKNVVEGRSFVHFPFRVSTKIRNNNIEKCTELLNDGTYDVETFLKQVTFLNAVPITSLETSEDVDDLEITICDITVENNRTKCVICNSNERVIAYIPCNHLAQCADCEINDSCVICGAKNVNFIALSTKNENLATDPQVQLQ